MIHNAVYFTQGNTDKTSDYSQNKTFINTFRTLEVFCSVQLATFFKVY